MIRSSFGARASIRFASGAMEMYEDTELQISSTGDQKREKDIRGVVVRYGSVLFVRFDPRADQENYRKGILPHLNEVSGLFVQAEQVTGITETSHASSRIIHAGPAEDPVTIMSLNQDF